MRRRKFLVLFGGSVAAWPLAARAQQGERVPHIDILMNADNADLRSQHCGIRAIPKAIGLDRRSQYKKIDTRWSKGPADIRRYALELAGLAPDIIVVTGTAGMSPMLEATRTVSIVLVNVAAAMSAFGGKADIRTRLDEIAEKTRRDGRVQVSDWLLMFCLVVRGD